MTTFCAQCGNPLRSGGRFCQSCGTPAQPSAPPPQAPPQASGYSGYQSSAPPPPYGSPAPYGAQPAYPPAPQSSTNWLKILLITMAIIIGLVGVSIIGVAYFIRSTVNEIVKVEDQGGGKSDVSIKTPVGGVKISSGSNVTEEQLAVPIYPGAVATKDSGSVSISGRGSSGGWIGAANYTTEDDIDKVVDFYQEKLGESVQTVDAQQNGKRTVNFQVQTEKGHRIVTVTEEGAGVTKISIVGIQGIGETK